MCSKFEPPPNVNSKCEAKWFEVEIEYLKKFKNTKEFDNADQVEIISGNAQKMVCYNPSKLLKYGWCKVLDASSDDHWGICSPSCLAVEDKI